jgi:hypothetical protein
MHRRAFLLSAALSACVSTAPPDDPGDACAIFEQHDTWWSAVRRAERRWGAPPALVLAIIRQESGFDHNARPARGRGFLFFPGRRPSSAMGYAQALESTWAEYERAVGDAGVDRDQFRDAADFVAWYTGRAHRELGIDFADARSQYFAYHEGFGDYRRGSYRGNQRLSVAASRVQGNHDAYHAQLERCESRLNSWWPFSRIVRFAASSLKKRK